MEADQVVIFVSKYHKQQFENSNAQSTPYYLEIATGSFRIPKDNQRLKECFLKIRQDILRNREKAQ